MRKCRATFRAAVEAANADDRVHVIVLEGAGKAFCAGYDLKEYAEGGATNAYTQPMPWDPMIDYKAMSLPPAVRVAGTGNRRLVRPPQAMSLRCSGFIAL